MKLALCGLLSSLFLCWLLWNWLLAFLLFLLVSLFHPLITMNLNKWFSAFLPVLPVPSADCYEKISSFPSVPSADYYEIQEVVLFILQWFPLSSLSSCSYLWLLWNWFYVVSAFLLFLPVFYSSSLWNLIMDSYCFLCPLFFTLSLLFLLVPFFSLCKPFI